MVNINSQNIEIAKNVSDIADACDILVSALPNDNIINSVFVESMFYKELRNNSIHMSCATISPHTARQLSNIHFDYNQTVYVSAPVFARPDGMARAQATIPVSCVNDKAKEVMKTLLETTSTGM